MAANPRVTLEQWQALLAVVEKGSYARAAEALHKSQSAVTYAVQKVQSLLGVKAFEIRGRKAVLTESGQVLYRRARTLVEESVALERGTAAMTADWKPEMRLAVEGIFPTWLLLECLARFANERPETRVELYETVLGGTDEALTQGKVDLAICALLPPGYLGDLLMRVKFVAVAHPDHPLHRLGRAVTYRDLRHHRQLVIRDSGVQRSRTGSWLGAEQRWTVSNKATSIRAATMGLGFAWYPEDNIRDELDGGTLKPLPLEEGAIRWAELYLVFADRDYADRDTLRLAEIIRESVASECARQPTAGAEPGHAGGGEQVAGARAAARRRRKAE
jgi:DNA-binding transcriptional LysR family regulator